MAPETFVLALPLNPEFCNVFVMTAMQTNAFNQLLASWRRREECRDASDISGLSNARHALDTARAQMRSTLTSTR